MVHMIWIDSANDKSRYNCSSVKGFVAPETKTFFKLLIKVLLKIAHLPDKLFPKVVNIQMKKSD